MRAIVGASTASLAVGCWDGSVGFPIARSMVIDLPVNAYLLLVGSRFVFALLVVFLILPILILPVLIVEVVIIVVIIKFVVILEVIVFEIIFLKLVVLCGVRAIAFKGLLSLIRRVHLFE